MSRRSPVPAFLISFLLIPLIARADEPAPTPLTPLDTWLDDVAPATDSRHANA